MISLKEIDVESDRFLFVLVNSAWMSVLDEIPGKIIIPKMFIPAIDSNTYKAVFAVSHHPLNWYDPDNIGDILTFFRSTADILIFGHEHRRDGFNVSGPKWSYAEFHGRELQDSNSINSAFTIYNFEKSFQNYDCYDFEWDEGKKIYCQKNVDTYQYHKNSIIFQSVYQPNRETMQVFNDVGITITHFSKEDVVLSDLFVWPELIRQDFYNEQTTVEKIRDNVFENILEKHVCTITGGSLTGKTSLAKMLFLSHAARNSCCLLIKSREISVYKEKDLRNIVDTLYKKQYNLESVEEFQQLPNEKRIVIIDDFDSLAFYGERRDAIVGFFCSNFGHVILMVTSDIDIPSICSNPSLDRAEINNFEILPLGNRKRKELISKWYYLHEDISYDKDIERRIERSVQQINTFLGNGSRFLPALPIFIIGALQDFDALTSTAFSGSQYGFLYESLVLKSLSTIAEDYQLSGTYNIDINILSQLAYSMLDAKKTSFSQSDLQKIVDLFNNKKKLNIDANQLRDRMYTAKILCESKNDMNNDRFKYPYIFYYFVGRYIAYHHQEADVQSKINYMSSHLYNEIYGNIMIFVCHFANSENIIIPIVVNAYDILSNYCPFDFHASSPILEDIKTAVNVLLPSSIGDNEDVSLHKEESLTSMDDAGIEDGKAEEIDGPICDELTDREKDLAEINASLKTLAVLGQILQNYPGAIDGDLKIEIISEVHKLGMRLIEAIVETAGYLEENLVSYIADTVAKDAAARKDGFTSMDQIALTTRNFLTVLVSRIIRDMISRIAACINSKYLLPASVEALSSNGDISSQLILQELKINYLKNFSLKEVADLYDDLLDKKENFSCGILRSIVAHYLRYNVCDFRMRANLCSKFNLSDRKTFLEAHRQENT